MEKMEMASKIGEVHSISIFLFCWVDNLESQILKSKVLPSVCVCVCVGGGLGGIHPLPQKLACPPYFPLFCPQKFNFVICMQFLAIMPPTLVKTKSETLKKGNQKKMSA